MVAERRLNMNRLKGCVSAASLEFLQISAVRGHDDRGRSGRRTFGAEEGLSVGLHRPIEIVEFGILIERGGIDARGLALGLGADDLRILASLRADGQRLLL